MPTITPKPRKTTLVETDTLEEPADLTKPKPRATARKDLPVSKIVSTTLETRISSTLAKTTSMAMINMNKNIAITGNEAYNIFHPALRMLSRRLPDVALKTNLSKPDADDLELIIITTIEYMVRVIDGWAYRMYMRATGQMRKQQTMAQPTERDMPKAVPVTTPPEPELEEFMPELGEDVDIAPMKNGNGSIAQLIDRGIIPTDMGDNIA